MSIGEAIGYAVLLFMILAAVGVLTSRTAIERLVAIGVLPRAFAHFVPALTLAARALAIALILIGCARLAITAGWLSRDWLERYGFAAFLVVLGSILLLLTLRRKREG
ncbi:MAG: hypothetical protein ABSF92_10615 [Candidatus Acidiferrales bacterium]|jgi:hypothetical protein